MATKRDERTLRSQANRRELERRRRAQEIRRRLLMVAGVLTAASAIILPATRRRDARRVWSPEHGRWNNR